MAHVCEECGARHLTDDEIEDLVLLLSKLPTGADAEMVHLEATDRKKLEKLMYRLGDLL